MKLDRYLFLVIIGCDDAMSPAVTTVAQGLEVSRLLTTSRRIADVVYLSCRFLMASLTDATGETYHFEAKV